MVTPQPRSSNGAALCPPFSLVGFVPVNNTTNAANTTNTTNATNAANTTNTTNNTNAHVPSAPRMSMLPTSTTAPISGGGTATLVGPPGAAAAAATAAAFPHDDVLPVERVKYGGGTLIAGASPLPIYIMGGTGHGGTGHGGASPVVDVVDDLLIPCQGSSQPELGTEGMHE